MTFRTDAEVERLLERLQNDPEFNLTHPWTVSTRVPIVHDFHPRWAFVATLLIPRPEDKDNFWKVQEPEEADAELLSLYIQYTLLRWYYPHYVESLKKLPVDIDPGTNTMTFAKVPKGWVYRRATWEAPTYSPQFNSEIQFATLLELLDNNETRTNYTTGEKEVNEKWVAFKETHDIK